MRLLMPFLLGRMCPLSILAQTTAYSQFSGAWNAPNLWNTAPDGSGTNYPDGIDDPTISAVVQSGHTITMPSTYSVNNLFVEAGATLKANVGVNRYIQVYGTSVILDGTIGGAGDGFSLDINGSTCDISGSGSVIMSRLQKDCGDPGIAATTNLTISRDLELSWSSSASLVCIGNPSNTNQRTFNVTISSGVTVSVAGDVSIDGNSGTNSSWQDGTFTINGTLDIADDLFVTTISNPAGGDISYIIGNGGRIIVRSQVVGNSGATGAANANLTIQNGGTLELNGSGIVFTNLSPTKNVFTLQPSSTMEYSGISTQTVEDFFIYSNVIVSGGGQKNLEGNTAINGILTLTDGIVQLGTFNFTINPGGSASTGSENSYVRTNSTGLLRQTGSGSEVHYPLGNSSYNPFWLTNGGTSDIFSARVLDDVFMNGTGGPLITNDVADRTWLIDEASAGGSSLTLEVQWNGSEELSGFDRGNCYISYYTGGGWSADNTGAAVGSDPYTRSRSGITNLSPFAVASSGALPVELSRFEAELRVRQTHLAWSTASETNNAHFIVERGADGRAFSEIGRVAGAGTVRETREYIFVDERPLPGANYYRLRQVDFDGQFSFSPVRRVVVAPAAGAFLLYPSPASDFLQIHRTETTETDGAWEIFDAAGRQLMRGVLPAENETIPVFVGDLMPGVYFFRFVNAHNSQGKTFVKQ